MKFKEAKLRVIEIRKLLSKWSKEYYENNAPIVDDLLYDELLFELSFLEEKFSELIIKDSPTQIVGSPLESSSFLKTEHIIPMLSLKNAFNNQDLKHFNKQINEFTSDYNYYVEPKIDGLSISLLYKNGNLFRALTRGDGMIGEDVTNNVKQIKNIPHKINNLSNIEFRGEIYIPLTEFEVINEKKFESGEQLFANPRNAASGTLRQLDPQVVSDRNLEAIIYWAMNYDSNDYVWHTQSKTIKEISKLGFGTFDSSQKASNITEVIKAIEIIGSDRYKLNYEIDGIVVKVNNSDLYPIIGHTSKFPKWSIAYKFPAKIEETILLDIFPTVGRTGRVTYNAKLKPVKIDGTIVQKATLHNADYIRDLDLRIGDTVKIKKAGEIIPKVISVSLKKRKKDFKIWKEFNKCQKCNKNFIRKNNEVDQYCINFNCPSILLESIIHFSSREAMNIEGLSTKQIEKFIELNWIKDVSDIYKIKNRREELLKLEGYQEKSVTSLINSIEKTKNNYLSQLLFGLGIRHIGKKTSKDLSNKFHSLDIIINSTIETLLSQDDLGEVKSQSIIKYFNNKKNIKLLKDLNSLGVNPKSKFIDVDKNNKFFEKKIVITGIIEGLNRIEAKNYFESLGANVMSSISETTDFLISGKNSSKNKLKKIDKNKVIKLKKINDLVV
ncbi:MAG: NAD-dependent DNA ligase LigA [Mycoplasmataceae bacterium]|nr:NAD-dependent DNA ligase LigA [Mycoplasmataceae bacterium]